MIPRGFVRLKRRDVGLGLLRKIKEDLLVVPRATSSFQQDTQPIIMWSEDGECIGVPRGYFLEHLLGRYRDFKKEDIHYEVTIGGGTLLPTYPIKPREGQEEVISGCIEKMRRKIGFGGAIAEVKTAGGKTCIGLEIARRIGMKTLVVVHTTILANQWKKEINQFFPEWRVGLLQADQIDIKNKDICIAILHSLAMHDYPSWVYDEFGFVIYDEVHVCGAPEFSNSMKRISPKYLLGLSGTLERKDRAENVFLYSFGPVVSGMSTVKVLDPEIFFVDTRYAWTNPNAKLDIAKTYSMPNLITNPGRNEILVANAERAAMAGRNPLVITERVEHAKTLQYLIQTRLRNGVEAGLLHGAVPNEVRDIEERKRVLVATVQLIGIGFNVPRLDTLIFATPINDIIQPIGRIRRLLQDKKTPYVIDPVDSFSKEALKMAQRRMEVYKEQGWKIHGESVFAQGKQNVFHQEVQRRSQQCNLKFKTTR